MTPQAVLRRLISFLAWSMVLLVFSACQLSPVPQPTATSVLGEATLAATAAGVATTPSVQGTPTASSSPVLQPHGDSYDPDLSADGRYIAFTSRSQDLAGGRLAACPDLGPQPASRPCAGIFVYDTQTGSLELVSVNTEGEPAGGESTSPQISADGRWVAFTSLAGNLDAGNPADTVGIFVHDRQTGKTELVSANATEPSISADGRFVAFTQLGDLPSIAVLDRQTSNLVGASGPAGGTNGASLAPHLSADGRWLAFWSWKDDLVERDVEMCGSSDSLYNCGDVFLYNGGTAEMKRVKVGLPYGVGMVIPSLSLTSDGRMVAYSGQVYDRLQGLTQPLCGRGDQECPLGKISSSGQVAAYRSEANYYRFDRQAKTSLQVDVDLQGQPSDAVWVDFTASSEGESFEPGFDLSADGRFIAFSTTASTLQAGDRAVCSNGLFDPHNCYDIYLYDALTGAVKWISQALR